jgi:hypothetical protein
LYTDPTFINRMFLKTTTMQMLSWQVSLGPYFRKSS